MNKHTITPLELELEKMDNLIGNLESGFTNNEFDIYTKIANVCLNIGEMRICFDKIEQMTKEADRQT